MKKHTIEIPLYECSVTLYYGNKMNKVIKYFNKQNDFKIDIKDNEDCYGLVVYKGRSPHILIEKNKDKSKERSVITHECFHAAMHILNHLMARVDYENQEPFAYLLDFIYREIDTFLYKKSK